MTTSTAAAPTKAALLERIAELEAQIAATSMPELQADELQQTLWVGDTFTSGRTNSGRLKISFSAQKGAKNNDGRRCYGPYRYFVAYGDVAEQALAVLSGDDRLVEISAFESVWGDSSKRSDWVLTSIVARERMVAPVSAPPLEDPTSIDQDDSLGCHATLTELGLLSQDAAPFSAEPTLDEIPF